MSKRIFLKGLAVLALSAWMLPGFAAEPSDPPEGFVTINYFRTDADYSGWGLHVWSRIPGGADSPLDGVNWMAPLKPKGKTEDGGVYWQVKVEDFGKSGKVWYIIHKRDTKEQGGKDQSFDGKTIKQVWVNHEDPVAYTSKEEAIKARQK